VNDCDHEESPLLFNTEDQVVEDMVKRVDLHSLNQLATFKKEELGQFHHTFGRWVRNFYRLWDPEHPLTRQWHLDCKSGTNDYLKKGVDYHPNHPDNMSMKLMYRLWHHVRMEPYVEDQEYGA
jgi:hypothetical protein